MLNFEALPALWVLDKSPQAYSSVFQTFLIGTMVRYVFYKHIVSRDTHTNLKQRFYERSHSLTRCNAFWYFLLLLFFFFFKLAAANSLSWQHGPLNGGAHSLKSTAVGLELGTMDSSTKMWVPGKKRDVLLAGRQHPSPVPRCAALRCGLDRTITAIPSMWVHHCQQFFWSFGHHVNYPRKLPSLVGFVLGPFKENRELGLLLAHLMALGNWSIPYKGGDWHGAIVCSTFTSILIKTFW